MVGDLGEAYNYCRTKFGKDLVNSMVEITKSLQTDILGYSFKNPLLLIEALTHRSASKTLEIPVCYEKLEVLGDSILDYLCNFSLIRYTLFERYLQKDPDGYQMDEHFTPTDAH
jgi:endoribonuclease Dicer